MSHLHNTYYPLFFREVQGQNKVAIRLYSGMLEEIQIRTNSNVNGLMSGPLNH